MPRPKTDQKTLLDGGRRRAAAHHLHVPAARDEHGDGADPRRAHPAACAVRGQPSHDDRGHGRAPPLGDLSAARARGEQRVPRHRGADPGVLGDGPRPQHHRRLRGAARPRVRGLLRARRAHRRLVHVGLLLGGRQGRRGLLVPRLGSRGEPAGHPPELRDRGDPGDHHLRDRRHADRPADAAPARRLHRDRHAGVRRDHRPHRHQRRRAALQGRAAARRPARGRVRQGGELLRGQTGDHTDRQDRLPRESSRSSRSTCARGSGRRSCWS